MKKLNFAYIKQLIENGITFYKDLISNESETSSKRYIMLGSFYMLCILALLNQLFGLKVDLEFTLIFACIATGTAVLTVIENIKVMKQ